ncbi:hypothetical protein HDE_12687 [Halotydeus destructor]|nr:hypothetical protein HDE_12687 [Halotydeus destructor]
MSATEVEEVFAIESRSGVIGLIIVNHRKNVAGINETKTVKQIDDTSCSVFTEKSIDDSRKIALLKIGPDEYCPLEKDKTIVYRLNQLTYLIPPDRAGLPGQFLVLQLSQAAPDYLRRQFDEILNHFATLVEEVSGAAPEVDAIKLHLGLLPTTNSGFYPSLPSEADLPSAPVYQPGGTATPNLSETVEGSATAKMISQGIVSGAEYVAYGLSVGTNMAEDLVHKGGHKLVNRETRTNTKQIDPKVITGLKAARIGADVAAVATTTVVGCLAEGTRRLSEHFAPHIHRHGTKLMSDITGKDQNSSSKTMSDIMSVTASGFHGFGTLFNSVAENSKVLAKAVASETVNYVHKRYGTDAGTAADEALNAAGSGYIAATAMKDLAPKAMVKKVGKEAAKSVVSGYGPAGQQPKEPVINSTESSNRSGSPTGNSL